MFIEYLCNSTIHKTSYFYFLIFFFFLSQNLFAQVDQSLIEEETKVERLEEGEQLEEDFIFDERNIIESYEDGAIATENSESDNVSEELLLPLGFLNLKIGTSRAEVNTMLIESPWFFYAGEPEVSFRSPDQEFVFDVPGLGFIDRALFQFKDFILVSIDMYFDETLIDYYSLHTTFTRKYGPPTEVHPRLMAWENSQIIIRVLKEGRVQYIGKDAADVIPENLDAQTSVERFLDIF